MATVLTATQAYAGSNPVRFSKITRHSLTGLEHLAFNQGDAGSNPVGATKE